MSVSRNTALSFSEEQVMLMDVAREFCRTKSPIAVVREHLETESGYDANLYREMVELGWLGVAVPEALGGAGLGPNALVPVFEAIGKSMLGTPLMSTTLALQLLLRAANSAQLEHWVPGLVEGQVGTVALLDNGDWGAEQPTMALDDEGVLWGDKYFVTDAHVADAFVVVALHRKAPALALVCADDLKPNTLTPHTLIDQTKRAAAVDFSGVQVAQSHIITGEKVASALRDLRLIGALLVAAEATGTTAACMDSTVEYLNTRKQFGKLIGSYQALKHPMVDVLVSLDSARSFIYHAATLVGEESLSVDAEVACRMAKAQASEALRFASDRAVQFHGGMGFTYECDAQLYIRRAQWSQQQFGDAQQHRKQLATLLLD